ncbi:MAG: hypothetical protein JJE47_15430 [Acidimicrobiia bacterium]|nr:hypothetical protein [Acidimicrobiia bacterium]
MTVVKWITSMFVGVLALGACTGGAQIPVPTLPPLDLPASVTTSIPETVATTVPSSTTTTMAGLPIVDLLLAQPYGGSGCLGSKTMLTNTGGVTRFVWLLDPATLEAATVDVRLLRTDSLVYVLDGSTVIVRGLDGLALVEGGARTVLLAPPESDAGVFEPTVWVLDVSCADGVVAVATAGVVDDLAPVTWAIVAVDAAGTTNEVAFDPGVLADGGLFSPDGAYLLVGAYGPDPAFGGLHRVIDVSDGSVVTIGRDLLAATEQSRLTRIGWVDSQTLYVEREDQVGESTALLIGLPDVVIESVEPGAVELLPVFSCVVDVSDGWVSDATIGRVASINGRVHSVCW